MISPFIRFQGQKRQGRRPISVKVMRGILSALKITVQREEGNLSQNRELLKKEKHN